MTDRIEEIKEKVSDTVLLDVEGDVVNPADVANSDIDPDRIRSSVERIQNAANQKHLHNLEPTPEEVAEADQLFEQERQSPSGVSVSLKKRAKAITTAVRYYEQSEHLSDMERDAKSFKPNKFNQAYSRPEMKAQIEAGEEAFANEHPAYQDAIKDISRVKQLLAEGFTPEELQIAGVSRAQMRNMLETLRRRGGKYEGRFDLVNELRKQVGLEPVAPTVPDHLKSTHIHKLASPESDEKTGCDCNCQVCDSGGGLHCHNERTNCFI